MENSAWHLAKVKGWTFPDAGPRPQELPRDFLICRRDNQAGTSAVSPP